MLAPGLERIAKGCRRAEDHDHLQRWPVHVIVLNSLQEVHDLDGLDGLDGFHSLCDLHSAYAAPFQESVKPVNKALEIVLHVVRTASLPSGSTPWMGGTSTGAGR